MTTTATTATTDAQTTDDGFPKTMDIHQIVKKLPHRYPSCWSTASST